MNKRALGWIWKVSGREKLHIAALMCARGLIGVSTVAEALLLRSIVDSAVAGERDGFWHFLTLLILVVLGQITVYAVIRRLSELTRASLENIFKARLLEQLLHRDYAMVSAIHSGEWMNRLTNDTAVVASGCEEILPGLAGMFIKLAGALAAMIILDARFARIILPAGAAALLLTVFFRKVMKQLHKNVQEQDGRLRVFLQERIGSMMIIRSFAADVQTGQEAAEKMDAHKSARMRKNRFFNFCNIGFNSVMNGMYLFGVGYCGYGILTGSVSYGTLTAILQLIGQVQAPFANITGYLPKFFSMLASAERLMEAEDFPEDGETLKDLNAVKETYADLSSFGLRDASFTYYPPSESVDAISKERMPLALENISLDFRKGESVAFTGQSGCGKSTILKLLMCVYHPDAGVRYFTDGGGKEQDLTSAYRRMFAYVPQGNVLMSGKIREIVAFADMQASQDSDRLWQALRIACADGFVSELDDGLDTVLGERGAGLSEGQMQRLSIARAVFSGSPILLLDEATSSLDAETEKQVLNNLKNLTDRTVVIVTHQKAVLSVCDRVLAFTKDEDRTADETGAVPRAQIREVQKAGTESAPAG